MIHLMNTVMMPDPGFIYKPTRITPQEAKTFFSEVISSGREWRSYIGYQNTRDYAEKVLELSPGIIPLSRYETHVKSGDEILSFKLKQRLTNPGDKASKEAQDKMKEEDFEIWLTQVN